MKKGTKYAIIGVVVAVCGVLAYNAFIPKENKDLKEAPGQKGGKQDKVLAVRAVILKPQRLTDGLIMSGSLIPDEEVSLSFETSGKITDIYFKEGSTVHKEGVSK